MFESSAHEKISFFCGLSLLSFSSEGLFFRFMPCSVVLEDGQPKPEQCIGRKLKFETLITINWDDFRAAESNPGRDSSSALFDIALSTQSTALLYNEKKKEMCPPHQHSDHLRILNSE